MKFEGKGKISVDGVELGECEGLEISFTGQEAEEYARSVGLSSKDFPIKFKDKEVSGSFTMGMLDDLIIDVRKFIYEEQVKLFMQTVVELEKADRRGDFYHFTVLQMELKRQIEIFNENGFEVIICEHPPTPNIITRRNYMIQPMRCKDDGGRKEKGSSTSEQSKDSGHNGGEIHRNRTPLIRRKCSESE